MQSSIDVPALASHQLTERLDRVLLHPLFGLPIFFGVMFGLFQLVFTLGKPLQDALAWGFGELRSAALEPLLSTLLSTLPAALQSSLLQGFLLDGLYNGLSTVASFVPLIVLFFLFMGMVEDAGYLSRAAFLMDGLMARFGLDGRSFVMLLMGFGCNVPALMGTRVIRSRGLRLLTMLVIPFSLCSARMQVFVFFIAILFSPSSGPLVLFSLYLFGILSAVLTSLLFKRQLVNNEAFVLEMPPYRFPTLRQMLLRGWSEVGHFLKRATRFIIAGVTAVWLLTHFPADAAPGSLDTWAGQLGSLLDPLMRPLGIDPMLTIALMFGFIAKEIVIGSLAVIYNQEGSALSATIAQQIDAIQAYSFMLFTLIYTPCLSTVATLQAESKSLRFTVMAVLWPLLLAWLASFVFYQLARLLTS
jgi:ferrous iron transport protein B